MNYSTIERYLLNIRNRLDLRRLWFVSVNQTKSWLEKNLSLIGRDAGERFGGGLQALTKEVDTDSRQRGWGPEGDEVIYGTGVLLNDRGIDYRFGGGPAISGMDYSYPVDTTFNVTRNEFSYEDQGETVGMTYDFIPNSQNLPVSMINSFLGSFAGAGYPFRIVTGANPQAVYKMINYVRDNRVSGAGVLPSSYGLVQYSPAAMNHVLSQISPLVITNTTGW